MMTIGSFTSLFLVVAVTVLTPGPNNFIVMATAKRRGFLAAMVPAFGVVSGGVVMIAMGGLGLGSVFLGFPLIRDCLTVGGALYLIWLGYQFVKSDEANSQVSDLPSSFPGVMLFQFLNPKAWVIYTTSLGTISNEVDNLHAVLWLLLVFLPLSFLGLTAWAALGTSFARIPKQPLLKRLFDISMAAMLIAPSCFILVRLCGGWVH